MTVEVQIRKITQVAWVSQQLIDDIHPIFMRRDYAKLLHEMLRPTARQNIQIAARKASDAYSRVLLTGIE